MEKGSLYKGVERKAGANAPVFLRLKTRLAIALAGSLAIAFAPNLSPKLPLGGLDPKSLFVGGVQGWYFDNSDLDTLYVDVAGTVRVSGAGDLVAFQRDKSGNGNHRFQSNAANRPVLRYNWVTGAHYLETDGVDDGMQTAAINFTGTDKVTLFTGVRKLSDAATGMLVELSGTGITNAGTFNISAPNGPGSPTYGWRSRGSVDSFGVVSGLPAPRTSVLTMVGNISGSFSSLAVNGSVLATQTASQGTGTFGNYPAYFFRRAGTSLPFNGHEYGSICVGRLCTPAEIAAIERLLARKVGVTLT